MAAILLRLQCAMECTVDTESDMCYCPEVLFLSFLSLTFGCMRQKTTPFCVTGTRVLGYLSSIIECKLRKITCVMYNTWDHSGYGISQWKTTLQCNIVYHWLSQCPERSLKHRPINEVNIYHLCIRRHWETPRELFKLTPTTFRVTI